VALSVGHLASLYNYDMEEYGMCFQFTVPVTFYSVPVLVCVMYQRGVINQRIRYSSVRTRYHFCEAGAGMWCGLEAVSKLFSIAVSASTWCGSATFKKISVIRVPVSQYIFLKTHVGLGLPFYIFTLQKRQNRICFIDNVAGKAEELYLRSIRIGRKLFGPSYSGLEYDYRGLIQVIVSTAAREKLI
jgi:hypothetical protein